MTPERATNQSRTRSAECAECGDVFEPTRDWSRFCGDACRAAYWRRTQTKSPPAVVAAQAGEDAEKNTSAAHPTPTQQKPQRLKPGTKLYNVLAELARGSAMTRFDAERICHDHVLPSTVSEIEKRGISVSRKDETVPGYMGHPTHCARYWLEPGESEKAAALLGWADGKP